MLAIFAFFLSLLYLVSAESSQNSRKGYNLIGAVVAAIVLGAVFILTISLYCCFRKSIGKRLCRKKEQPTPTTPTAPSCRSDADTASLDGKTQLGDSPTISAKKVDVNIDLEKAEHRANPPTAA